MRPMECPGVGWPAWCHWPRNWLDDARLALPMRLIVAALCGALAVVGLSEPAAARVSVGIGLAVPLYGPPGWGPPVYTAPPYYYGAPAYIPPPVYVTPPVVIAPPGYVAPSPYAAPPGYATPSPYGAPSPYYAAPPGYGAPSGLPPGFIAPPGFATRGAQAQFCDAAPYRCPMERPTTPNASCYCSGNQGQRVTGTVR